MSETLGRMSETFRGTSETRRCSSFPYDARAVPVLHVVIPFYNEGSTLAELVDRVVAAPLPEGWRRELVLVDDHSRAEECSGVRELMASLEDRRVDARFLRHERNRGKGAALRTGFDAVLERADDADLVIIQDADLEYDPRDYASLMAPILAGEADAVFGARWGEHFRTRGVWRKLHAFGNRTLTSLSNLMTGHRVSDMECCYKVFPVPVLRRLRPMMTEDRFGVEPQLAAAAGRLGLTLAERPVRYEPRAFESGKKIGWRDGVRAVWVMLRERFRRIPPANPEQA